MVKNSVPQPEAHGLVIPVLFLDKRAAIRAVEEPPESAPIIIELAGIEACPLSEWLHRARREAAIPIVCIETRQAQCFLSSRPVKTEK